MNQNYCRLCHNLLVEKPLLTFRNMPASAQGFPTEQELSTDSGSELEICQCKKCGMVQITGEPVPYYKDVIRATGVSEEMKVFRRKQFAEWITKYNLNGKKIIEIGCGRGEYMDMMAEHPVELFGLEHNQDSIEAAKTRGLHIFKGYIENTEDIIEQAPFDGFYILNFLEHIPKPKKFLQGICNNLNDDAVGIVEVPNFDMILEKKLFSEFISDHLMYFTKDTLTRMLECNGFEVLEIQNIWYDYIISAVVKKRKQLEIISLKNQKNLITNQLWNYITKIKKENGKLAVWGAGHQALAIMAMTEIHSEIDCVIDSAEFKQNKYTPATHITIVSPQILEQGDITDVLIIAGGFSDEISSILKCQYPNINHAILRDDKVELC